MESVTAFTDRNPPNAQKACAKEEREGCGRGFAGPAFSRLLVNVAMSKRHIGYVN
jgi:hypothetical protein